MTFFGLFPKKPKSSHASSTTTGTSDDHSTSSKRYDDFVSPKPDSSHLQNGQALHVRSLRHELSQPMTPSTPSTPSRADPRTINTISRATLPSPDDRSVPALQPPPSRSAVFGGYAYQVDDRPHLSTQSLPDEASLPKRNKLQRPPLPTHQRTRSSSTQEEWGGSQSSHLSSPGKSKMFGWMSFKSTKSSTTPSSLSSPLASLPPLPTAKALPTPPPRSPPQSPPKNNDDSFKVTAFRQVRPVSPGPSIPYANGKRTTSGAKSSPTTTTYPSLPSPNLSFSNSSSSLNPPPSLVGRERQDSIGSNSSQRVTVAAFRQAQARRSSLSLSTGIPAGFQDSASQGRASPMADPDSPATPSRTRQSIESPEPILNIRSSAFSSSERSQASPTSSARTFKPTSPTRSSFTTDAGSEASPSLSTKLNRQDTITQRTVSNGPSTPSPRAVASRAASASPANSNGPPPRPSRDTRPPAADSKPMPTPPQSKSSRPSELPPRAQSQMSGSWGTYKASAASRSTPVISKAKDGRISILPTDSDTSEDDDEESSSDEDAPLSNLPIRRPGTSMSMASTTTSRTSFAAGPLPRSKPQGSASQPMPSRPSFSFAKPPTQRSSTAPLVNLSSTPVPSSGLKRPVNAMNRSTDALSIASTARDRSAAAASAARPFAYAANRNNQASRSPASSTGDSSSGKHPLTPRDGSEPSIGGNGTGTTTAWSSSKSSLPVAGGRTDGSRLGHTKRPSVSFEMPLKDNRSKSSLSVVGFQDPEKDAEIQRRERRRSEAKAAIELGNVVNGPPPRIDDQDDAIGQLASAQQQQASWEAWQAQTRMSHAWFGGNPSGGGFTMPQIPPNADPTFMAAHQQAMLIAKQTYQMAVAQQALQAANDEWERSSNVTAFQGGGYGTPAGMGGMNMAMNMSMGVGMGMGMGGMSMFPPAAASMYGGGGGGGGSTLGVPSHWGSGSVYGGSFGPSRTSGVQFPGGGSGDRRSAAMSEVGGPSSGRPRQRTRTAPSNAPPPPAILNSRSGRNAAAAPSSWRMN